MAPIASTATLSHRDGISDSARARELYKYYQPTAPINQDTCFPAVDSALPTSLFSDDTNRELNVHSSVTSSKISSPDTALTAFCQLTTWRVGAQRAMISLIDAETQYFIAESTKTVDLVDNTQHGPGDEIWMGCSSVTKAGRLCERTIEQAAVGPGDYPAFIVNDLRADDRFNELPFVTGSPFLRFYAGVPLITKRGIPIGSLFVVDDRARDGLNRGDVLFMGTIAETIMRHLEMVREVEEHRRGMKMSRGLASFVEGRAELVEAEVEAEDGEGNKIAGQFETEPRVRAKSKASSRGSATASRAASIVSLERKEREYSAELSKTEEAIMSNPRLVEVRPDLEEMSQAPSFEGTTVSLPSPRIQKPESLGDDMSEGAATRLLFSRAANLIREAFEVDGGAVFYDAQQGFSSGLFQSSSADRRRFGEDESHEGHTSGEDTPASEQNPAPSGESKPMRMSRSQSPLTPSPALGDGHHSFSRSATEVKKPLEVLGFSTPESSSIHGDPFPGPHCLKTLDNTALNSLLKHYPRGKLWTFDSDGAVSSSSEEEAFGRLSVDPAQKNRDLRRRRVRNARHKSDAKYLSYHFNGVRQLLFVPLWDASRSRWLSGCFVWSTEPTRVLSKQSELAFLSAFGNSVMAECSRIDTEVADQKKGDFIGSISHELRSPLHGILASAEFLSEEKLSSFEKGLVETIDSCGRTLLDTINHILDFSKINQFEKVWRKSKRGARSGPGDGGLSLRKSDLPMVNLFAEVDVSIVCEEVVEGVFAGHVFQNLTAGNFDIVPGVGDKMLPKKSSSLATIPIMGAEQLQNPQVQVVFDVDLQSYNFCTQPGAFRRVIMNLLGNALKYTSHGFVCMKLQATPMEPLCTPYTGELVARSLITISIRDTGRGISSEFLRSKVFTPFAQENSLSSGTGLGLSIVRSIVALLEGEITIDSEVGRGTDVRVTLPLLHEMPKTADSGSPNTKSSASAPRETDDAIKNLRAYVVGRKVSLHGFDIDTADPIIREMHSLLKASISNFLTKWYGFQVVPLGTHTNLIISNEAEPATISKLALESASVHRNSPPILVLCSQSARFGRNLSPTDTQCNIGYVAKPVGPLKLAKAIMQCIEGVPILITPGPLDQPYASPGPPSNDMTNVFEELSSSSHLGELLDNSRMAADSANARKAIESPTPNAIPDKIIEFPFPMADLRPKAHSMPASKEGLVPIMRADDPVIASLILTTMEQSAEKPALGTERPHAPSLLLVDDNKINLKLLSTYMRKKNYPVIDEAENGLEAVTKFAARPGGYDIIFMDISMPILDGFGATCQIRALEKSRGVTEAAVNSQLATLSMEDTNDELGAPSPDQTWGKAPALVIALTGLASGRDQQEAANVGIDIFLTKPVSFKEVGKLLENWEANRVRDAGEGEA